MSEVYLCDKCGYFHYPGQGDRACPKLPAPSPAERVSAIIDDMIKYGVGVQRIAPEEMFKTEPAQDGAREWLTAKEIVDGDPAHWIGGQFVPKSAYDKAHDEGYQAGLIDATQDKRIHDSVLKEELDRAESAFYQANKMMWEATKERDSLAQKIQELETSLETHIKNTDIWIENRERMFKEASDKLNQRIAELEAEKDEALDKLASKMQHHYNEDTEALRKELAEKNQECLAHLDSGHKQKWELDRYKAALKYAKTQLDEQVESYALVEIERILRDE